ncbi:MAG: hypothetical protein NTZ05_09165 [Chloroflexi bacterium]|nr:hypothetical protein [Chloroflexota bacterium]
MELRQMALILIPLWVTVAIRKINPPNPRPTLIRAGITKETSGCSPICWRMGSKELMMLCSCFTLPERCFPPEATGFDSRSFDTIAFPDLLRPDLVEQNLLPQQGDVRMYGSSETGVRRFTEVIMHQNRSKLRTGKRLGGWRRSTSRILQIAR